MPNLENVKQHLSGNAAPASSQNQLLVVIGFAILILVITVVFGVYASRQFSQVQSAWSQYSERESRFNSRLANLHRALGYGGFIHNFKNLVLRRDIEQYGTAVDHDIKELNTTLRELEELVQYPEDLEAIRAIRATANKYFENYRLAKQLIKEGADSARIDPLVRVDDTPALLAIGILESHVKKDLLVTRHRVEKLNTEAFFNLAVSGIVFFVALTLGVVVIIQFDRRILRANADMDLAQARLNNLLEYSPDAMLTVDENGTIVRTNKMAERFFGYSKTELVGMSVERLMPEQYRAAHVQHRHNFFQRPTERSMGSGLSLVALTKDGDTPNVDISLSYVEEKGFRFATITLRDATARERDKRALENAAFSDSLTGLANRRKFFEFAEHEIARAKRSHTQFWFLAVDIDDFKNVNDTAGHTVGDRVIRAVAEVLQSTIRSIDLASRTGGEEFTLMLVDTSEIGAARVAENILSEIKNLKIEGWTDNHGPITVSIGCALYDEATDLEAVLRTADEAMYESKKKGKNRFSIDTSLKKAGKDIR